MPARLHHLLVLVLSTQAVAAAYAQMPCSEAWNQQLTKALQSADEQGHGPDLGSEEWKSVIEFKLGLRDQPGVPARSSGAWCGYIDQQFKARAKPAASQTGPAFSCSKIAPGSIEDMVCKDAALAALDRKLAAIYAEATRKAKNEHPPVLKAEQRGWVKGRNDCWKADDKRKCVADAYVLRSAELQARYRLVSATGPQRYACDGDVRNEIIVTWFKTEPPTLIAERGDSVSLMYVQPSGSGAKYQGRNESFWEHQGEARVVWGYGAPEMVCRKTP